MKKVIVVAMGIFTIGLIGSLIVKPNVVVDSTPQTNLTTTQDQNYKSIQKNISSFNKTLSEHHSNDHNHEHGLESHKNVDIKKYLTQEQLDELKNFTMRSDEGLIEDETGSVNLQKRYSHAVVSYIDENGNKVQGEL